MPHVVEPQAQLSQHTLRLPLGDVDHYGVVLFQLVQEAQGQGVPPLEEPFGAVACGVPAISHDATASGGRGGKVRSIWRSALPRGVQ